MTKMRTRSFQAMTNYEIEKYLEKNDVIFVPVGNAEMHGAFPVDCEYVVAEAYARLFAEQCDAIYMANNIYLYAGGTENGRGTVQMTPKQSAEYMYNIAYSLLRQGFRRQVYIPSHGASTLFMHPVIHQIMCDTKVPMLMLEPNHLFAAKGLTKPFNRLSKTPRVWDGKILSDEEGLGCHAKMLGAYQICGRLDDIPQHGEQNIPETLTMPGMLVNNFFPEHDIINECSGVHCPAPFFYKDYWNHGAPALPDNPEDIKREADIGEAELRRLVDGVDLNVHLNILRKLDGYIQNEVMPKHGDHLYVNR